MTISDIVLKTRFLCSATTTSYTAAQLLIDLNNAYEEVVSWILNCDGLWQFDDANFTNFPRGTTTLVVGQADYSFDVSMLEVERVSILDANGLERFLDPVDNADESRFPFATTYRVNGQPLFYDKNGSSVVLYPAPGVGTQTLASGLIVYFKRTAAVFTSGEVSTGTKVPGFASPFHQVLSYMSAINYCSIYKPGRVPMLMAKIQQIKKDIEEFYGQREEDRVKVMDTKAISHR